MTTREKTMNTIQKAMLAVIATGIAASPGYSQGSGVHTQTVPFYNPARPGVIRIVSGEGDITITGYSGREVRIKATASNPKALSTEDDPKAKGLKRVAGTGFSVSTVRDENAVVITRPLNTRTTLDIQVPIATSVKIGGAPANTETGGILDIPGFVLNSVFNAGANPGRVLEGDITVENISGELEIGTLDGDINLKNVSGAAVVSCLDGSITASFRAVPDNRPMAFSTIDGDVDVTIPERTRATISANNVDGGVYTDFELETITVGSRKEDKGPQGPGAIIGMIGNTVRGKINGGGADVSLKTIDGNIYIRRGK